MTFCRRCEVSWAVGERCWLCARTGEPGGFPKAWLSACDDHAEISERLARLAARSRAWRTAEKAS